MIGKTISHYRITEKLGEGGMGVVYKALDTKLDRHVAIKFLPPHLNSDNQAKTRFVHEAKAASALNHANIAVVHEIDETPEEQMFIVMAYYEGRTLKDRLDRGAISVDDTIAIVSQLASGLGKAHEKDILHRDIKPANILMGDDGHAKIADFGLAKLAGRTQVTRTGSTLGTVAYMSPEQASGGEVDQRSDLFSLGVVLYEALTGKLPFPGDHEAAVLYGIMNSDPKPLASHGADLPSRLQPVVDRALCKEPSRRYQTAIELLDDLKVVGSGGDVSGPRKRRRPESMARVVLSMAVMALVVVGGYVGFRGLKDPPGPIHTLGGAPDERIMIAVLPFANLGSPDDEFFADGITEEVTARLGDVQGLGVIARTSSRLYKNTDKNVREIGKELGVDYVLEGTIRWQRDSASGGQSKVRVTPRLIGVSGGAQLWVRVYEQDLTEIFQVQSDIASKVVSALNVSLKEAAIVLTERKPTENMEAYDLYLRGNDYYGRSNADYKRYRLAAQLYAKAIQLDPDFSLAHVRLSIASTECYWHLGKSEEDLVTAKAAMNTAMALDPELPDVHHALGSYYYHNGEYESALWEYNQVLRAKPQDSQVLREMGYVYRMQGDIQKALQSFEKATILDPRSAVTFMHLGTAYMLLKDYEQGEKYLKHGIVLSPDESMLYGYLAMLYVWRSGDIEAALGVLNEASQMVAIEGFIATKWWNIDILAGNYSDALDRLSADNVNNAGTFQYLKAYLYGLMGDSESERRHYQLALAELQGLAAEGKNPAWLHLGLGRVYAGLGRRAEAVSEADEAGRLEPTSKDSIKYFETGYEMAQIYALAGDHEKALDQLELIMSFPQASANWARLDPAFASLGQYSRFQNLSDDD